MAILVTGHAGFIGFNTCKKLIAAGEEVIGVDSYNTILYSDLLKRTNNEELCKLSPRFKSLELDVAQIDIDFLRLHRVTRILHFAALPGQVSSWRHFGNYLSSNVHSTQVLLEAVKSYGKISKFIQISTSSVYGKVANAEDSLELNPSSPYGVTKLAAENLVRCYANVLNLDYVVLRYFSVFGPGQRPDMAISQFLTRIKMNEDILATGDGTQIRDLTYVDDVADSTISALHGVTKHQVYDISGGETYSINQVIASCLRVANSSVGVTYINRPIGDQERTKGDRRNALSDLQLQRTVTLEEGIANQLDHMNRRLVQIGKYE